jgi:methylated-DNA-[protein]-cysteine S-methyltransferase
VKPEFADSRIESGRFTSGQNAFNLPICESANLRMQDSRFTSRVRSVVRRIPHGRVATYGDVAAAAGRPRAHRAVGNIMRATSDTTVPCHRVIAAGGKLGGYGRDLFAKRALLLGEGVLVSAGRIQNFAKLRWNWKIPRKSNTP